jgi:hypothetical protein
MVRLRRALAIALALALTLAPARAMDNPGPFALLLNGGDFPIGAAGQQTGTPLTGLAGLKAVSLQIRLNYVSGGTKVNVYVQTSLDQGQSFFDIVNIAFTTSGGTELVNLSALDKLTTPTVPTVQTLADNTVLDGVLGDRLQVVVVVSAGTAYGAGSLVSVRGVAR